MLIYLLINLNQNFIKKNENKKALIIRNIKKNKTSIRSTVSAPRSASFIVT